MAYPTTYNGTPYLEPDDESKDPFANELENAMKKSKPNWTTSSASGLIWMTQTISIPVMQPGQYTIPDIMPPTDFKIPVFVRGDDDER